MVLSIMLHYNAAPLPYEDLEGKKLLWEGASVVFCVHGNKGIKKKKIIRIVCALSIVSIVEYIMDWMTYFDTFL